MNSRKSVRPRMEPWGTPALTGYSFEDFPLEPLKAAYYWQNYKAKIKKE